MRRHHVAFLSMAAVGTLAGLVAACGSDDGGAPPLLDDGGALDASSEDARDEAPLDGGADVLTEAGDQDGDGGTDGGDAGPSTCTWMVTKNADVGATVAAKDGMLVVSANGMDATNTIAIVALAETATSDFDVSLRVVSASGPDTLAFGINARCVGFSHAVGPVKTSSGYTVWVGSNSGGYDHVPVASVDGATMRIKRVNGTMTMSFEPMNGPASTRAWNIAPTVTCEFTIRVGNTATSTAPVKIELDDFVGVGETLCNDDFAVPTTY
jgi:hypothetical protein